MTTFDPIKWLVSVAGFINDWLYSREWPRLLWRSIPVFFVVGLVTAVVIGGLIDRTSLRDKYLQLGQIELERWQEQLGRFSSTHQQVLKSNAQDQEDSSSTSQENEQMESSQLTDNSSTATATTQTVQVASSDQVADSASQKVSETKLSPYAEMLFRRAHLLLPTTQTQFVIGASLWQRGAVASAKKALEKVAPNDYQGYAPAHAVLAKICRDEYAKSNSHELAQAFQHHAQFAMDWPYTFLEVKIELVEMLWRQGKQDESLKFLGQVVKHHPDLTIVLVDRAKLANKPVIAQSARQDGIEHFRRRLADEPKTEEYRIQLAALLALEQDGESEAESLLSDGLKQFPSSRLFARSLSEVYCIRFARSLEATNGETIDLALLENALQIDPTNPKIAETVAIMLRSGKKASKTLEAELYRTLVTGQANMATHAILSDHHLLEGRLKEAKMHLEQVNRQAPMSVKYANNLAFLYAKENRLDEAERVAVQTLSLIQLNRIEREPYVDELLDTLGMVYEAKKQLSDAIAAYSASLKLNPKRVTTHEKLARVYSKSGDKGAAQAHLEEITRINQSQAEAAGPSTDASIIDTNDTDNQTEKDEGKGRSLQSEEQPSQ